MSLMQVVKSYLTHVSSFFKFLDIDGKFPTIIQHQHRITKATCLMPRSNKDALSDYLVNETPKTKKAFLGSHLGGDKNIDGEIITKHDGSKLRRRPRMAGILLRESPLMTEERSAGSRKRKKSSHDDNSKDGKKSKKPSRKSFGSFLGTSEATRNHGGSASGAGDKMAIGKESSLTGKNCMREDGQRHERKKSISKPLPMTTSSVLNTSLEQMEIGWIESRREKLLKRRRRSRKPRRTAMGTQRKRKRRKRVNPKRSHRTKINPRRKRRTLLWVPSSVMRTRLLLNALDKADQ